VKVLAIRRDWGHSCLVGIRGIDFRKLQVIHRARSSAAVMPEEVHVSASSDMSKTCISMHPSLGTAEVTFQYCTLWFMALMLRH
jgi:hypothetical protein